MSDSERVEGEALTQLVEAEDADSVASSYASPKDYVSATSGASEAVTALEINGDDDAPAVSRLKGSDTSENEERRSDAEDAAQFSPSPSEEAEMTLNGVRGLSLGEMADGELIDEPEIGDELAYAHRPIESTPTRKSLSQAARELAAEGVPKADKTLARCLSGLTAEVLGDEGRLNSPLDDKTWRTREKHFFILSSAGKPIYSRYGDEGALCGMMAILEAIVSVVESKGEETVSIVDGPLKIVFLSKGPVLLVGVSRRKESIKWILKQLDYLYNHVLCLATGALLNVLKQNPGQDIRHLLKGSTQMTERLILDFGSNPGLFLESFFPVRMLKGIRHNATAALTAAAKVRSYPEAALTEACQARASFLLFDGQVVCMTQESGSQLEAMDLLLLLNFVLSNDLYRSQSAAEYNAPVCMPHLHETAFLHAYIYFLEKNPDLVVLFLMTQPDTFHVASEARKRMETRLRELGIVHSLRARQTGAELSSKGQILMEEMPLAAGGGRRELSAVQTFLFRRRSSNCPQYILCKPGPLFTTDPAWQSIMTTLASVHLERQGTKKTTSQKVQWHMDGSHSILYDSTADWDMYLVCDPLTMKEHASSISKQIVRFLLSDQVKEELFMVTGEK